MEVVVENTVFNSVFFIENLMFSTFSLFRAREQQFSLAGEEMRGMTYLALPSLKNFIFRSRATERKV